MTQDEMIICWSEKILKQLLQLKKEVKPDITFGVRQRESDRFNRGFWFPGSYYIFVGLVNRNDSLNKTAQAGLVFNFRKIQNPIAYFQIVFRSEKDRKIVDTYQEAIREIGGFVEKMQNDFRKPLEGLDFMKMIDVFYSRDWKTLVEVIRRKGQAEELIISEDRFTNLIESVEIKRANMEYREKVSKICERLH